MTRIAVIGCGLIGGKRAAALPQGSLVTACDIDPKRAEALARAYGANAAADWRAVVADTNVDAVIVATTHDLLAPIATEAARNGKHVLMEKPGARRASELDALAALSDAGQLSVRIGFNHRYHRAMQKARELIDADAVGPLMYMRGRYGHGGRPGYEREWRAVPDISGGGEGIDQGIHLIDLARWYFGDFPHVYGSTATYFWKMPVEDNIFMLLRTAAGETAQLHASWTEWKNLFSLEITGRDGKIEINGLGGSYGTERITLYAMLPEMGPPETTTWEYPWADDSWHHETNAWLDDIAAGRPSTPGVLDAQRALEIVERIYADGAK